MLLVLMDTQLVQGIEHFGAVVAAVLEVSVLVVGVDVLQERVLVSKGQLTVLLDALVHLKHNTKRYSKAISHYTTISD